MVGSPAHRFRGGNVFFSPFFLSRRGNGRFDMQRTLVRVAPVFGLPVMDDAAENERPGTRPEVRFLPAAELREF